MKGTKVTLTAAAGSGFVFTNWSGACSGSNRITSVTLDGAKNCRANFTQRFTLTVTKSGTGTVTSSPEGIDCGSDCNQTYNKDTKVTLTAAAGSGFVFANWSGACSGSNRITSVILTAAKSCTADFEEKIERFTLAVTKSGMGTVTSSPGGIDCGSDCNETYDEDTAVTLTAAAGSGFVFKSWGGACSGATDTIATVTVNAAKSCIANFERERFTLTVTKSGTGTVTSSPGGIDCGSDCNQTYNEGTEVTLTAVAGSGFVFLGLSGTNCGERGGLLVINTHIACIATFAQPLSILR